MNREIHSDNYMQYSCYRDVIEYKMLKDFVHHISVFTQGRQNSQCKILDIGCGIGGISFPLSYLGYKVTGVDVDSKSVDFCNRMNTSLNAKFLTANAVSLDLQEQFDIIICSRVIEHLPEPQLMLRIIKSHLASDGVGIITIPNGFSLYEMLFSRFCSKIKIGRLFHKLPAKVYTALTGSISPYHSLNIYCEHVNFFSYRRFKKLLNESGFRITDITNLSLGLFLTWKLFHPLRYLEAKLSDYVPHFMAGAWNFVVGHDNI